MKSRRSRRNDNSLKVAQFLFDVQFENSTKLKCNVKVQCLPQMIYITIVTYVLFCITMPFLLLMWVLIMTESCWQVLIYPHEQKIWVFVDEYDLSKILLLRNCRGIPFLTKFLLWHAWTPTRIKKGYLEPQNALSELSKSTYWPYCIFMLTWIL